MVNGKNQLLRINLPGQISGDPPSFSAAHLGLPEIFTFPLSEAQPKNF
jgi:hypothetical protein